MNRTFIGTLSLILHMTSPQAVLNLANTLYIRWCSSVRATAQHRPHISLAKVSFPVSHLLLVRFPINSTSGIVSDGKGKYSWP